MKRCFRDRWGKATIPSFSGGKAELSRFQGPGVDVRDDQNGDKETRFGALSHLQLFFGQSRTNWTRPESFAFKVARKRRTAKLASQVLFLRSQVISPLTFSIKSITSQYVIIDLLLLKTIIIKFILIFFIALSFAGGVYFSDSILHNIRQWSYRETNVYKNKELDFEFIYPGTFVIDPSGIDKGIFKIVGISKFGSLTEAHDMPKEALEVYKSPYKDFSEMADNITIDSNLKYKTTSIIHGEPALIVKSDGLPTYTYIVRNGLIYKFTGINTRGHGGWMLPKSLENTFRFNYTE